MADLQAETADVLSQLIRFNTVNPPGNERDCLHWLAGYLTEAGLECELDGSHPDRPNLVARLRGESGDGPVLGYLGHVDTVLADAADWTHDPWCGDIHDGFLWGRGAIDMKSQVAAEAVAAAHLARSGWRPANGELRLFAVCDEEVGGILGAKWLTEERPDLARCDMLLNEGAGLVMPYGDRRLYGVCCAEKGTFRFRIKATGAAGHASIPAIADNALLKLAPALTRLALAETPYDLVPETRAQLAAIGQDPSDPGAAVSAIAAIEPRLAALVEPALKVTLAPTRIFASEKINVIPAHAELQVDCRVPPGMGAAEALERIRAVVDPQDGIEIEFLEQVVGNRSGIETRLMTAITEWVGANDPGAEVVPTVLPAFTDSRWWRHAFPECVAYGFFPQRHQNLYDAWPLVHARDERIDIRDLGFAAAFFAELAPNLLGS